MREKNHEDGRIENVPQSEADRLAFTEDALSEQDALDSIEQERQDQAQKGGSNGVL
jgi:hypothetical protein